MALLLYTKRKIKRINICEFAEALPCKILILPPMQCLQFCFKTLLMVMLSQKYSDMED